MGALDEDRMEGGGWRGAEAMRGARATDPLCCVPLGGCLMGGWEHGRRRRRSAVLPVAVGHGILSLLLLKELCDGQQLFQHVLHRGNAS